MAVPEAVGADSSIAMPEVSKHARDAGEPVSPESTSFNIGMDDLPPEILWQILMHLPPTASTAQLLCGVCREWRDAILSEDNYLTNLTFALDANQPFRGLGGVKGAVAHRRTWEHRRREDVPKNEEQEEYLYINKVSKVSPFSQSSLRQKKPEFEICVVPLLLEKACQGGKNVSALECLGTLRETQGDLGKAHKAWKRAAKLGSAGGQFKLGEIFYRGLGNHGVDGEEALFWLNKATKGEHVVPLCAESLATAAGIMGFLHLDGEGTQACNTSAVKWFRVAQSNGNKEASKTLGWLYNTGQY